MSEFKANFFQTETLDNQGNAIVFGEPATTTNRNPNLDQVVRLFHGGSKALTGFSNHALHKLGNTLLAANDSLAHSPLWNDIGGFVDEDGRTLPAFAPTDDGTHEVERKRQYLSRVIIPADISAMVAYLKDDLRVAPPPADDRVPTTGPATDAFTLRRLLAVLPQ
jgi:hypothetical protein